MRAILSLALAMALLVLAGSVAHAAAGGGNLSPTPEGGAEIEVYARVEVPGAGGGVVTVGQGGGPPLVIWTATPAATGVLGGGDFSCDPPGVPAAEPGEPSQGWYWLVTAVDAATGALVSTELVCAPLDPDGAPAPPNLPEPPTVGEVWDAVAIPAPGLGLDPAGEGVTGLETRLWSGGPTEVAVSVSIRGYTVAGTARLVEHRFDAGDGAVVTAGADAGGPASPAATHTYEVTGTYRVGVTTVWEAEVTVTGPLLPPVPTDLGRAVVTAGRDYDVVEVRSVLLPSA